MTPDFQTFLYPGGDAVFSPSGQYRLGYENDGSLLIKDVFADGWPAVWSSGTSDAPGWIAIGNDGNLVIFNGDGAQEWDTGTSGNSGAYAGLLDDGSLVIFGSDGSTLWHSN